MNKPNMSLAIYDLSYVLYLLNQGKEWKGGAGGNRLYALASIIIYNRIFINSKEQ